MPFDRAPIDPCNVYNHDTASPHTLKVCADMDRRFIVRADIPDDPEIRKKMVTEGLEAGFYEFMLRVGDERFSELGRMDVIYTVDGTPVDDDIVYVTVDTPEGQSEALNSVAGGRTIIVETGEWSVIPIENMIARFRGSDACVLAVAHYPKDAETFLGTLECGTDGVVISVTDPSELSGFRGIATSHWKEALVPMRVISVRPIGLGDRVCVDTCSIMPPGEGMLIGSSSNCLFLIQSESEENGYVATRPFRVNAGAVHSYILVPGGGTRYLSELLGGDPVLICDRDGNTRNASIGRCKVEVRPLLMVEATDGRSVHNVILQNAETIKVVCPDVARSVTVLKPGDEVLARLSTGGMHLGTSIDETIVER